MALATHQMELGGYHPLRPLGHGTFGTVYLCRNAIRQLRCVKGIQLLSDNSHSSGDSDSSTSAAVSPPVDARVAAEHRHMVQREIYLLTNLQHPRIVRCEEYFEVGANVYIVMEYAAAGNLQSMISARRSAEGSIFAAERIVRYFCEILVGMEYLHMRHVIHRDLKPENILVDAAGQLKIADFGISKIHVDDGAELAQPGTGGDGTLLFMAPEAILTRQFTFASDMWALGCIFYELCTLRSPFSECATWQDICHVATNRAYRTLHADQAGRKQRWLPEYTEAFERLAARMLEPEPERRASIGWLVRQPAVMATFYEQYFDYSNAEAGWRK